MKTYRDQLIDVINNLCEARGIVFEQIISLGKQNESKEIVDFFDKVNSYSFDLDHFDTSSDANLAKIVELCKNIQDTVESLMDLNQIEEEDLVRGDE